MAERTRAQRCPLCGQEIPTGDGLEALGKHFQRCPKTEGKDKPAKGRASTATKE